MDSKENNWCSSLNLLHEQLEMHVDVNIMWDFQEELQNKLFSERKHEGLKVLDLSGFSPRKYCIFVVSHSVIFK